MKKLLVLLAAVAFVVTFTAPAMAADWGFYGSARMMSWFNDYSKEATGTGFSDDDLAFALQGNSRIGAKVKAGAIGGKFEYGTGINLRLLFGTWNFGGGTLLVGQDYTPLGYGISSQAWDGDYCMSGFGGVYAGRYGQIKLTMGGFQAALISPNTAAVVTGSADLDTSLPKIEARYKFDAGPIQIYVGGGYQTFDDVVQTATTEKSYGIDSTVIEFGGKYSAGPFSVALDYYTGTNVKNYGLSDGTKGGINTAAYYAAGDKIEDADTLGYLLVLSYKISDMLKLEGGFGVVSNEIDVGGVKSETEMTTYYVQLPITVAKGFSIVPEVGSLDYGDVTTGGVKTKQGDLTYFGAKWAINF